MSEQPTFNAETNVERIKQFRIVDDFTGPELAPHWDARRSLPQCLSITDELNPGEKPVLKVTVHLGDLKEGNTERAEITEERDTRIPAGVDIWYGFSMYVPEDFPIVDNRLVIAQWKQPAHKGQQQNNPFISLQYRNGKIIAKIVHENEKAQRVKLADIQKEEWNRILVNYQLNADNTGHCQFIVNGKESDKFTRDMGFKELSQNVDENGKPEKAYFKMGLYRDTLDKDQTLYFDKFRRGESKEFCE